MPRALGVCTTHGCWRLAEKGSSRCDRHNAKKEHYQAHPRGSSTQQGYGSRWRRYRLAFLTANPLCIHCLADGVTTPATVVDHIKPHRGDARLFWDPDNHQPLCKRHHDAKTAREGRWGGGIKSLER